MSPNKFSLRLVFSEADGAGCTEQMGLPNLGWREFGSYAMSGSSIPVRDHFFTFDLSVVKSTITGVGLRWLKEHLGRQLILQFNDESPLKASNEQEIGKMCERIAELARKNEQGPSL